MGFSWGPYWATYDGLNVASDRILQFTKVAGYVKLSIIRLATNPTAHIISQLLKNLQIIITAVVCLHFILFDVGIFFKGLLII